LKLAKVPYLINQEPFNFKIAFEERENHLYRAAKTSLTKKAGKYPAFLVFND